VCSKLFCQISEDFCPYTKDGNKNKNIKNIFSVKHPFLSRMCLHLPVCIVQTSLRLQPCICLQPLRASLYRKEKTLENLRSNYTEGSFEPSLLRLNLRECF